MENLKNLLNMSFNKPWKLVYQATKDGFEPAIFHSKCDQFTGTLSVIKTQNSNIFGGYTSADWSGVQYKSDSTAFLFSLVNSYNVSVKMNIIQEKYAINCYPLYSVVFGGGHDLFCSSYYNIYKSNLGHSYQLPNFLTYGSNEAQSFLAGSPSFQPVEIEVYYVEF